MRVVVREAFKAYINMQPENFHVGQKLKGDTAVHLIRHRAPVDPEDDEAAELAAAFQEDAGQDGDGDDEDQEVLEDTGETEPPHPPPGPSDPDDPGASVPPPSSDGPAELDADATVADVLAWVGEDQDRAAEALAAEQAKEKPRSTLVKALSEITTD
ncbi:hypothetical protein OOK29_26065 [Streptomyces phaeochromogenes]|uniref:hypothetical protein n=1 Tax=Streptomyces phaeochromogenes TaxID=1923 RepID=UPI00225829AA|nr:hypothetical protein [Streptomyces phaeochromogenes]MCX5601621.1 hypothetical protein [Streptomyces phaeochromogenes]